MKNIITIHQPVFFPYAGTISKIKDCDTFIFLDDVQFDDGGYQNRNKVLTKDGAKWITVPLKSPRYMKNFLEIEISNTKNWQYEILTTLKHIYGKSKYFPEVFEVVVNVLQNNYKYLVDLNIASMMSVLDYLNIKKKIFRSSSWKEKPINKTDRIIYLVNAVDGTGFISGDKAKEYLEVGKFEGIELIFQNYKCVEYPQKWSNKFIPNMSIIDYLMYLGNDITYL